MTKTVFILAGGNDRKSADYGHRLSEEVAKYTTNPRILSCFFSWPEETWEQKAQDWKGWFSNNFTQAFTYDYAKLDSLLEQIDTADARLSPHTKATPTGYFTLSGRQSALIAAAK